MKLFCLIFCTDTSAQLSLQCTPEETGFRLSVSCVAMEDINFGHEPIFTCEVDGTAVNCKSFSVWSQVLIDLIVVVELAYHHVHCMCVCACSGVAGRGEGGRWAILFHSWFILLKQTLPSSTAVL